jgi:hypothetical protein
MDTEQRQVLRGFLANLDTIPPLIFTFQYNPSAVSDNKTVTYSKKAGNFADRAATSKKAGNYADRAPAIAGNIPNRVYTGGPRTISFDLKLHGLEQGTNPLNPTAIDNGISTELAKLRSFLYPKADAWGALGGIPDSSTEGTRVPSPPTCYFGFGTKILECIVTDIKITETQFNSALAPVRADVSVTLEVIEDDGNALYQLDKQRRNLLAALGLQNIRVF